MFKSKKFKLAAVAILMLAILLSFAGCESSAVSNVVFSGSAISDEKALDKAVSLVKTPAGSDLYASILFIESPEGMKYSAKWICDGSVVKEEEKQMPTGPKGIISYLLEGDKLKKGSYKFEIYYRDKKIYEEEVTAE